MLFLGSLAFAAEVDATCARVVSIPLPAPEVSLAGCDPVDLYYGLSAPADPVKARHCARSQLDAQDGSFVAESVLIMIYANGKGAARDYDLALKLACTAEAAVAERELRVANLLTRSQGAGPHTEYDFCDDITSGSMMGYCSGLQQRLDAPAQRARKEAALAKLDARSRAAFVELEAAAKAFFEARVANEVDQSGTARGMMQNQEQDSLDLALIATLERVAQPGLLPPADLAKADQELNAAYGHLMEDGLDWSFTTVKPEGIRATERLWIPYRDAWAAFGVLARPGSTAEAWKTWATRERVKMLKELEP